MTKVYKRILVFNVNWLGDVLFTTPAIRVLRKSFPDSYIACAAPARCAQLLKNNPSINEFISFDERGSFKSVFSKIAFIFSLRKKKFDAVFLFHRSFTRLMICFFAGIKNRIGYSRRKNNLLLTGKIDPIERDSVHRIDYFLNIVRPYVGKIDDKSYELKVNKRDILDVRNILEEKGVKSSDQLVVLNPGANWPLKRWPVDNFAKLINLLSKEPGLKVIVVGAKEDQGLVEKILSLSKSEAVVLTGQLNLIQLAALFSLSSIVISADSGPMHIAIAVEVSVIALFGPTDYRITGPVDVDKNTVLKKDIDCDIPCFKLDCADNICMSQITAEEVLEVIKTKLLMRP
ncbi:MAG: lipopolysaccharide heptosyltransferase II [Candidatus Gygaella obscura]|nr:lipopolysaccharide heptosyltransferase II [Candidatus Gygaella obscura]